MVFDKQWFQQNNKTLCWFANAPVIKYWFRWLLRIHNDVSWDTKINQITPYSFTYEANGKYKIDFRTHDKFSKRLYYGLKPLWYILHFMDWAMLDRCEELSKLSFGFSTLTFYPDAGSGNTTVDGYVREYNWNVSFSTLRSGSGYESSDSSDIAPYALIQRAMSESGFQFLVRSIFTFDTSPIGSGATITAAVLSLRGNAKENSIDAPNAAIDIYTSAPANNNALVAGDFDSLGTTSQTGSAITYGNFSIYGYSDFTFNATGRGNISKTGISKFGARESYYDAGGKNPGVGSTNNAYLLFQGYFSDQTGTTTDPKLVVTGTGGGFVAGPVNVKTYKGLAAASVKTCKGLAIASVKSKKGLA